VVARAQGVYVGSQPVDGSSRTCSCCAGDPCLVTDTIWTFPLPFERRVYKFSFRRSSLRSVIAGSSSGSNAHSEAWYVFWGNDSTTLEVWCVWTQDDGVLHQFLCQLQLSIMSEQVEIFPEDNSINHLQPLQCPVAPPSLRRGRPGRPVFSVSLHKKNRGHCNLKAVTTSVSLASVFHVHTTAKFWWPLCPKDLWVL